MLPFNQQRLRLVQYFLFPLVSNTIPLFPISGFCLCLGVAAYYKQGEAKCDSPAVAWVPECADSLRTGSGCRGLVRARLRGRPSSRGRASTLGGRDGCYFSQCQCRIGGIGNAERAYRGVIAEFEAMTGCWWSGCCGIGEVEVRPVERSEMRKLPAAALDWVFEMLLSRMKAQWRLSGRDNRRSKGFAEPRSRGRRRQSTLGPSCQDTFVIGQNPLLTRRVCYLHRYIAAWLLKYTQGMAVFSGPLTLTCPILMLILTMVRPEATPELADRASNAPSRPVPRTFDGEPDAFMVCILYLQCHRAR